MPAYVTIPKSEAFGYQGAVYLGKAFNPFEVGADPGARRVRLRFQAPACVIHRPGERQDIVGDERHKVGRMGGHALHHAG